MNLEARKIEFVKAFLNLQSEEVIARLEKILKKEAPVSSTYSLEPMTQQELNERIDQSEADFKEGRVTTSAKLLKKYAF